MSKCSNRIDITGKKFGRLLVIEYSHSKKYTQKNKTLTVPFWKCICDCGNTKTVRGQLLRKGITISCGCYNIDRIKKHGMSRTRFYKIYQDMMQRCNNKKHKSYKYYGERGIKVCERWNDFNNFYNDMFTSYNEKLTIDRINNNKEYSKDNCRWANSKQQQSNKRNIHIVTYKNITDSIKNVCKIFGFNYKNILYRLKNGLTFEEAITTQKGKHYKKIKQISVE